MNALSPINHHHHHRSRSRHEPLFPGWLQRIVIASLLLSTLFLMRACSLENERVIRDASFFGGVQSWTRGTGQGEVLFGSVTSRPAGDDTFLVEGAVCPNPVKSARSGQTFRWICDREGRVLRGTTPEPSHSPAVQR